MGRYSSEATPGHDCPGLIEAILLFQDPGARLMSTPGHDCPGLIEALHRLLLLVTGGIPTPGHDCPGLIEALPFHTTRMVVLLAHSGA